MALMVVVLVGILLGLLSLASLLVASPFAGVLVVGSLVGWLLTFWMEGGVPRTIIRVVIGAVGGILLYFVLIGLTPAGDQIFGALVPSERRLFVFTVILVLAPVLGAVAFLGIAKLLHECLAVLRPNRRT